jgi:hypothetical protein
MKQNYDQFLQSKNLAAALFGREMEERSGSDLFGNLLNTNVELNTRPVFDLEMEAS